MRHFINNCIATKNHRDEFKFGNVYGYYFNNVNITQYTKLTSRNISLKKITEIDALQKDDTIKKRYLSMYICLIKGFNTYSYQNLCSGFHQRCRASMCLTVESVDYNC